VKSYLRSSAFVCGFILFIGFAGAADPVERNVLLPPSKDNPRNSEAAMIDLADGRIMLVYSRFTGGRADHAKASLAARFSGDGGATWTKDDVAVTAADEGGMNTMSPSLLRMKDGAIGLFYLRKNSLTDCRVFMRLSRDEGKTWGEARACIETIGYYVMNDDRVVRLRGGRILLPVALHATPAEPEFQAHASIACFYTDDDGGTWSRSAYVPGGGTHALEEPGVIELKDGRVMLWVRTDAGKQFLSHSKDAGLTWSEFSDSTIASPRSPASIKRIPSTGDLLLVWNNNPNVTKKTPGDRTPFNVALSKDEGATWTNVKTLERDVNGWYCYTAIHFAGEHVVLAHCADDLKKSKALSTTQITRFTVKWLYNQ
jgi:Neuraminidase (sialidase)